MSSGHGLAGDGDPFGVDHHAAAGDDGQRGDEATG